MKTDAQLRAAVMRRVYMMYYARAIAQPLPRLAVLTGLAFVFVGSVSIVNVVANAFNTQGVAGFLSFVVAAFLDTTPLVQTVSVAMAAMLAWFVVDSVKETEEMFIASPGVPAQ